MPNPERNNEITWTEDELEQLVKDPSNLTEVKFVNHRAEPPRKIMRIFLRPYHPVDEVISRVYLRRFGLVRDDELPFLRDGDIEILDMGLVGLEGRDTIIYDGAANMRVDASIQRVMTPTELAIFDRARDELNYYASRCEHKPWHPTIPG